MNHFVMRVSDNLQEECDLAMLNDNMNISRLMVQDQQVEEARSKRMSINAKRERSFYSVSSKGRLEIQDKLRFKKRVSNKVHSKFPKARYDRVSNPSPKKRRDSSSLNKKPTCAKYGKGHLGECLVGTEIYFGCGKSAHKVKD